MKTPEKTEEDPHDPEPANKGNIWMEDSCVWLYAPSIGVVTTNYLYIIRGTL
jgi:hypothetical protein